MIGLRFAVFVRVWDSVWTVTGCVCVCCVCAGLVSAESLIGFYWAAFGTCFRCDRAVTGLVIVLFFGWWLSCVSIVFGLCVLIHTRLMNESLISIEWLGIVIRYWYRLLDRLFVHVVIIRSI